MCEYMRELGLRYVESGLNKRFGFEILMFPSDYIAVISAPMAIGLDHPRDAVQWMHFPFPPVVHNWSIKGCGKCCPVCILCGNSMFLLKKYVTMVICLMSNS